MTNAEKTAVAEAQAGKTRFDVYSAVMSSFSDAIAANETAMNSQGSAAKENAKYMESMKAKLTELKAQFQELVLGDGGMSKFLKTLLDIGVAILKFANSDVGQAIIQIGLLSTAFGALYKAVSLINLATVARSFNDLAGFIAIATDSTLGLGAALEALSINPIVLAITALAAAVVIGIKLYDKFNVTLEEHKKKLDELNSSYESAKNNVDSTKTKLEDIDKQIKEINSQGGTNIVTDKQLQNLKEQENSLKRQLALQESIQQQTLKSSAKEASATLTKESKSNYSPIAISSDYSPTRTTQSEELGNISNTIKDLNKQQEELNQKYDQGKISIESYNESTEKLNSSIDKAKTDGNEIASVIQDATTALKENKDAGNDLTDEQEDLLAQGNAALDIYTNLIDKSDDNNNAIDETTAYVKGLQDQMSDTVPVAQDYSDAIADISPKALEIAAKSLKMTTDEITENADAMGVGTQAYVEYASSMQNFNSQVDSIQSAYSVLSAAQQEYNENGNYSIDTLQKLLALDPEYLGALQKDGNQVKINTGIFSDNIDKQAEQAKQTVYKMSIEELEAIKASEAGDSAKTFGDRANDSVTGINNAANATATLAGTYATLVNEMYGSKNSDDVRQIVAQTKANIAAIDDAVKGLVTNFNGTMSGAAKSASDSAKKAAEDAEKAYKDSVEQKQKFIENQYKTGKISEKEYLKELYALNESYYGKLSGKGTKYLDEYEKNQQSIYDGIKDLAKASVEATEKSMQAQIDAIDKEEDVALDAIDKQIDALKDAEDAALKAIENQIDSLKDEKEDALNAMQDQIDALKKQKDAEDDYWDDRIDKLKAANTELSNQNQLMEYQQALAQAQQSKVMVLGSSGKFEYQQDQSSVSSAEKTLNDYQDQLDYEKQLQELEDYKEAADENYEAQIQALEDLKDAKEDWYDEQIEDLENYKDSVQEQYDAQIEQLNDYKDQVQEQYDAQKQMLQDQLDNYKNHEDELIAKQVEAINAESANWQTRLNNLQSFVNSYNAMLASLGEAGASVSSSYKGSTATSTSSSSKKSTKKHASGVASIASDETALVGDSPNQELVVGSKINGSIMNLPKGSGVVNAQSTKTLAGLINTLGSTLGVGNYNTVNTANTRSTSITISNLNVSSENGEELVNYLQNFGMQMTQDAYAY